MWSSSRTQARTSRQGGFKIGARPAMSARSGHRIKFARTRLSALLRIVRPTTLQYSNTPPLQHSTPPSLRHPPDALAEPREVAFVARGNGQHDEFRRVVGMLFDNELLQRLEFYLGRFENDQDLRARLDLFPPPVVRFYLGNQVGAGYEAGSHGGFGKTTSRRQVWRRD